MRTRTFSTLVIAACTAACATTTPPAGHPTAAPADPAAGLPVRTGDVHDFDFLVGAWTVTNRRLKARGVGSNDWDEFPATNCATSYLGGVVSVDELRFPTKGWAGVTVRTFQTEKRQWSIYWINSRTGTLFPPVVGGFTGNVGEFYGRDEDDGRPVKVRFRWTKVGPDRAHWEQAFSPDGRTWEVNWTNEFTRTDPSTCAGGHAAPASPAP